MRIHVFPQIYFPALPLSSPSGTNMHLLVHLLVPHILLVSYSFLFILFAFLINCSCSVFSLVPFSSVWTNLLLKISIEFFTSVVFFDSKNNHLWFFLMFSVSLLSFSFLSQGFLITVKKFLCALLKLSEQLLRILGQEILGSPFPWAQ